MVEMPKNNESTENKKEKTENKEIKSYDPNNSSKLLEEHKREENKEDDPDKVLQEALKNMDNPEKNEKGKEQLDYIKSKLLSEDLS